MNFTVEWDPPALNEFHELWAVSPDPAAIRAARVTAEQLVGGDPHGEGEYLSEDLWRVRVPPLTFYYTIDPDRQLVEITDVQATG
jgi:hypothetical protein